MAEAFICKRGRPARPRWPGVVSGTINKHYIPYRDQPTHSPNRCQTGPGHAGGEAAGAPKQSLTNATRATTARSGGLSAAPHPPDALGQPAPTLGGFTAASAPSAPPCANERGAPCGAARCSSRGGVRAAASPGAAAPLLFRFADRRPGNVLALPLSAPFRIFGVILLSLGDQVAFPSPEETGVERTPPAGFGPR